jgi:hypothetical protein
MSSSRRSGAINIFAGGFFRSFLYAIFTSGRHAFYEVLMHGNLSLLVCQRLPLQGAEDGPADGCRIYRADRGHVRRVGMAGAVLREPSRGQGRPIMNWVYWLSGLASLGIFVYLLIAMFKPEIFE